MHPTFRIFLSSFFALYSLCCFASERDSLEQLISEPKTHDTVRINTLFNLARNHYFIEDSDVDKAIETLDKAVKISLNTDNFKLGNLYSLRGYLYDNYRLDTEQAIHDYYAAISPFEAEKNYLQVSVVHINLGSTYFKLGQNKNAIKQFHKVINLHPKANDPENMGIAHENLAVLIGFKNMGSRDSAVFHIREAEKFYKEANNQNGLLRMKIGLLDYKLQEVDSTQYDEIKNYISQYESFLVDLEKTNQFDHYANALSNLGHCYSLIHNYDKAIDYRLKAIKIIKDKGVLSDLLGVYQVLANNYEEIGNYKEKSNIYKAIIDLKDSLIHIEQASSIEEMKTKYETEKKDAQIIAEKAENDKIKLEAEKERQQKYILYGGLSLALLFGGFIFNRFRVTRKQKSIIEDQKQKVDIAYDELEEKNKEILDSIIYAKRIQSAILPADKIVKEYLRDSFILYKPKDIVAGDFYWMEHKDNKVLFAAADCTGHGVPGAMVSVVCNNGLNRSVREHGLTEPGEILDKTKEIVIAEFEKSEEEVKDGMDVALCSLEANTLKYAGAHNPLWIIRKGAETIEEIKANKQPIGKYDNPLPYTTHTIQLNNGDSFYIFSDGYADQFGGEKGKKFKAANFKRLLLSIQNESMERQKELIDQAFEKWKGDIEQLDDVCVIGVRV